MDTNTFDWNAATQFAIALVTFLSVVFNWWSTNRRLKMQGHAMTAMKSDIRTVELATNSMKDALVASTASAAQAIGYKIGHAAGLAEQKLTDAAVVAEQKLRDAP